jgi:hypothetical protein
VGHQQLIAVDHHLQAMEDQNAIQIHIDHDQFHAHVPQDATELGRGHFLPDLDRRPEDVEVVAGVTAQGVLLVVRGGDEVRATAVTAAMMIEVGAGAGVVEVEIVDEWMW